MTRSGDNRRQAAADRALWRRGRDADAPEDEAGYFLDLAAFAEDRLDPDERERIAALLERNPAAREDIAATRALAGSAPVEPQAAIERIVSRATALVPRRAMPASRILAFTRPFFPLPIFPRPALPGLAQWASLAAALALIGWLGFAIGSSTASAALVQPGVSNTEASLNELFDPTNGFLRDLGGGLQT